MADDLNVWAWSVTPADNATADDQINWAEGQDPATVNNSARGMMAAIAKMTDVQSGNITVGGSANAITITTGQTISTGHQALGFRVCFKAAATNTGATTVAVDGLTAVAIKRLNGDALSAGDIVSGGIYDIAFDGTNYKLLGTSPATTAGEAFQMTSTDAGATAGPTLVLYRNSATPAGNDNIGIVQFNGEDSAGNNELYAYIQTTIADTTSGTEDGALRFAVVTAGTLAVELTLVGSTLAPSTDGGLALGTSSSGWSDLHLVSGATIDFGSDMSIDHAPGSLSFTGGGYFFTGNAAGDVDVTFGNMALFNRNGSDVASNNAMRVQRSDADSAIGYELVDFYAATGQVGSITLTTVDGVSGSVAYNTSSDGRRKPPEHRRPIDDSGQIIDALNPIRFRWDAGGEDIGFVAQEVVEVLPHAVKPGDDDPNKHPGDEGYEGWEMAVGKIEAILVAEIKALRARVAALEARGNS